MEKRINWFPDSAIKLAAAHVTLIFTKFRIEVEQSLIEDLFTSQNLKVFKPVHVFYPGSLK